MLHGSDWVPGINWAKDSSRLMATGRLIGAEERICLDGKWIGEKGFGAFGLLLDCAEKKMHGMAGKMPSSFT
jgi:hypothetical protein